MEIKRKHMARLDKFIRTVLPNTTQKRWYLLTVESGGITDIANFTPQVVAANNDWQEAVKTIS